MDLGERVRQHVLTGLDEADSRLTLSRADRQIYAPYVPFIMERLFSTLLAARPEIRHRAGDADSAATGRQPWYRRRLPFIR